MSAKPISSLDESGRVFKLESRVFLKCCERIGTVRALSCYLLASYGEWDQYLSLPTVDTESPSFADDYLVSSMMSKHPNLPNVKIDRKQVALDKWKDAEAACERQNKIISSQWLNGISEPKAAQRVRSFVHKILGDLTRKDLNFVSNNFRFGPGSTSACKGEDVVLSRKMTSRWDVTPSLLPYYRAIVPFQETFRPSGGNIVRGNKVTFVPKNSKTDRAIAIEPHGNIFVQLGIGALIRKRLLKYGIDLKDQKFKNRLRVQFDKYCATIDLSSASDTVSYNLVEYLLPPRWFELLSICRSSYSFVNDEWVPLQKFSSMGNGYTFELETLIFLAICLANDCWDADVFGDDIIVNREDASDVVATLELLGFSVNENKTFLAGKFYESCGVDVYSGVNVRPFFLKGKYETYDLAVIRIANAIRLYASHRNHLYGCDSRFLRVWLDCISQSSLARKTAASFPNSNGLWRDFDDATPSVPRDGHCGYIGKVISGRPVESRRTVSVGALLSALTFGPSELSRNIEYSRRPQRGFSLRPILFKEWVDLGAWV